MITFIVSNLALAGPNIQLCFILKSLTDANFTVEVLVISPEKAHSGIVDYIGSLGLKVIFFQNPLAPILHIRKTKYENNIIQTYGIKSELVAVLAFRGTKCAQIRSTFEINYVERFGAFGKFLALMQSVLLKSFEVVVVCSSAVEKSVEKYNLPTTVIPNCVDTCIRDAISVNEASEESYLDLSNRTKLTLYTIYSEVTDKHVDRVIRAIIDFPAVKLYVCGEVNAKMVEQYQRYDNVVFLGFIGNISSISSYCNAFISASSHEGMPNAVLEALSHGCYCYLSNIDAHNEIQERMSGVGVSLFTDTQGLRQLLLSKTRSSSINKLHKDSTRISRKCLEVFGRETISIDWIKLYKKLEKKYHQGDNKNQY